jgi:hypothetical protein
MSCARATGREVQNRLKKLFRRPEPADRPPRAHRARLHSVFTRYTIEAQFFTEIVRSFPPKFRAEQKFKAEDREGTLPFSIGGERSYRDGDAVVADDSELEDLRRSPYVSCGCSAPLTGAPVTSTNLTSGSAGCRRGRTGCCECEWRRVKRCGADGTSPAWLLKGRQLTMVTFSTRPFNTGGGLVPGWVWAVALWSLSFF